jgi:hypothetical protein
LIDCPIRGHGAGDDVEIVRQYAPRDGRGVTAFVAIIGTPGSPLERLVAFRHARWAIAAVVAIDLIPALLLRRASAKTASTSTLAANPQPS